MLEKFKSVQERARKLSHDPKDAEDMVQTGNAEQTRLMAAGPESVSESRAVSASTSGTGRPSQPIPSHTKPKSTLSTFGRFTSGVGGRRQRKG